MNLANLQTNYSMQQHLIQTILPNVFELLRHHTRKLLCKKRRTVYIPEEIVGSRLARGVRDYNIKWKNYPSSSNTWEPIRNLVSHEDSIAEDEKEWQAEHDQKTVEEAARNEAAKIAKHAALQSAMTDKEKEAEQQL